METLNQRLERVKDAHWDGEKLNLRQSLIFGTHSLTGISYEAINELFEKRITALAGFSPDDLLLIGHEQEVREYLTNRYIPEFLELEGEEVKRLLPKLKRNAISIYELLDQGYDLKFFHATKENPLEKHTLVLTKGKYSHSTNFTIGANLDTILFTAYNTINKEQKKDLL